jgi:hypothetical protein
MKQAAKRALFFNPEDGGDMFFQNAVDFHLTMGQIYLKR